MNIAYFARRVLLQKIFELSLIIGSALIASVCPASGGEQVGEAAVVTNVVTGSQSGQLFVSAAVFAKEEISASSKSHGELKLSDGSLVVVGENSSISLDDFVIDNGSFANATIKVTKGAFRFITGNSPKKGFQGGDSAVHNWCARYCVRCLC